MVEKQAEKKKVVTEHYDILGNPITLGRYVAIAKHNAMHICQITKITPKMMRAIPVKKHGYRAGEGWLIYGTDAVLLEGEAALAYILRN